MEDSATPPAATAPSPQPPLGRKYQMTMIGVASVLAIGILAAILKRFVGVDITELAKWAMVTVTAGIGLGAGSIAYEDAKRP